MVNGEFSRCADEGVHHILVSEQRAPASVGAPDKEEHMGQDLDSVTKFHDQFAESWAKGDGKILGDHFVEDASLINPFGERADGRAAIAAMYGAYFDGMLTGTSTTIRVENVRALGESQAFVDAEQTILAIDDSIVLVVHLAGLIRRDGEDWKFVDARPYAFAPIPS